MINHIKELYNLNPVILSDKKKCIFGTGTHAKQTYVELTAQGIKINCFADKNIYDSEASFMGVPLVGETQLKELNVSVIIASTAWEEISTRLFQQGITDMYVDLHRYGEVEIEDEYLCSVGKHSMEIHTLYILCPAGIGDTLYVAALAKAVKGYRRDIEKICLITKKSHACIADFFEGVDEVIDSNVLVEQLDLYSINTKTWYLKNYIYGHFKKNLCQTFDMEYTKNRYLPIINYYKKFILKIPDESELDSFQVNLKVSERKWAIEENEGDDQYIIFMPYANTAKMLPMEFWEKIAEFFVKEGCIVYTNVKDISEQPITGTLSICEKICNMVGICRNAELVISVRNGMCDVLAMSKSPLLILDTDQEFYERWNTKQLNGNAIHIKCFEGEKEDILEEIFHHYKKIKNIK